jgi:DNA-directed RNA polymerase specialized sigma24 family protein
MSSKSWIGIVRGIGGFLDRSALRTWIFGIVVNRARGGTQRGKA